MNNEEPEKYDVDDIDAELNLDEGERLPWLEPVDDFVEPGAPAGLKVAGFVLGGLVLIAAVVGGLYWYQNRGAAAPEADGSLVEAPEADYKRPPDDPQGREFAGQGDATPAASEGKPSETAMPAAASQKAVDGVLVQVGAYGSEAEAQRGWGTISGRYDFVKGLPNNIASATVDGATVYRLSVISDSRASAGALCKRLQDAGQACFVK